MKKIVTDLNVHGKKVLMRVDFNVPMKDGKITDENRIVQALPTIKYVIENGGKAIVFSHLGKVKTEEDLPKRDISPVAVRLSELLEKPVKFINATKGPELEEAIKNMNNGEIVMFQNTRYEDLNDKSESKNNPELGKYWASLGDLFVNDAFGTAHRAHASNVGIAANIGEGNTAAGFLMEKEIKFIGGVVDSPEKPLIAILGGAKVSDKIGVIENLLIKADKVLIGGAMAYTFFRALGYNTGNSLVEEDKLDLAKELLEKGKGKLVLPVDHVVATEFKNEAHHEILPVDKTPEGMMGLDVGPKTVELFKNELKGAKTVVWNGPMGVFEMPNYAKGTVGVCEAIAHLTGATTIIGGGDSAAAAIQLGFADKFTHISTGGGASLEYLEGKVLPGVESISNK